MDIKRKAKKVHVIVTNKIWQICRICDRISCLFHLPNDLSYCCYFRTVSLAMLIIPLLPTLILRQDQIPGGGPNLVQNRIQTGTNVPGIQRHFPRFPPNLLKPTICSNLRYNLDQFVVGFAKREFLFPDTKISARKFLSFVRFNLIWLPDYLRCKT